MPPVGITSTTVVLFYHPLCRDLNVSVPYRTYVRRLENKKKVILVLRTVPPGSNILCDVIPSTIHTYEVVSYSILVLENILLF